MTGKIGGYHSPDPTNRTRVNLNKTIKRSQSGKARAELSKLEGADAKTELVRRESFGSGNAPGASTDVPHGQKNRALETTGRQWEGQVSLTPDSFSSLNSQRASSSVTGTPPGNRHEVPGGKDNPALKPSSEEDLRATVQGYPRLENLAEEEQRDQALLTSRLGSPVLTNLARDEGLQALEIESICFPTLDRLTADQIAAQLNHECADLFHNVQLEDFASHSDDYARLRLTDEKNPKRQELGRANDQLRDLMALYILSGPTEAVRNQRREKILDVGMKLDRGQNFFAPTAIHAALNDKRLKHLDDKSPGKKYDRRLNEFNQKYEVSSNASQKHIDMLNQLESAFPIPGYVSQPLVYLSESTNKELIQKSIEGDEEKKGYREIFAMAQKHAGKIDAQAGAQTLLPNDLLKLPPVIQRDLDFALFLNNPQKGAKALSPEQLSPQQLQKLKGDHLAALSPEQTAQLLKSPYVSRLQWNQVKKLEESRIKQLLPHMDVGALRQALQGTATSKGLAERRLEIADRFEHDPRMQALPQWQPWEVKCLSPQQLRQVPPQLIEKWNATEVSHLTPQQFNALNQDQINAIAPKLSPEQILALKDEHYEALEAESKNALQTRVQQEPTINQNMLAEASMTGLTLLSEKQVESLVAAPKQISLLQPSQLSEAFLDKVPPKTLLSLSQVPEKLEGFLREKVNALDYTQSPDVLSNLSPFCLSLMSEATKQSLGPKAGSELGIRHLTENDSIGPKAYLGCNERLDEAQKKTFQAKVSSVDLATLTPTEVGQIRPRSMAFLQQHQVDALASNSEALTALLLDERSRANTLNIIFTRGGVDSQNATLTTLTELGQQDALSLSQLGDYTPTTVESIRKHEDTGEQLKMRCGIRMEEIALPNINLGLLTEQDLSFILKYEFFKNNGGLDPNATSISPTEQGINFLASLLNKSGFEERVASFIHSSSDDYLRPLVEKKLGSLSERGLKAIKENDSFINRNRELKTQIENRLTQLRTERKKKLSAFSTGQRSLEAEVNRSKRLSKIYRNLRPRKDKDRIKPDE